MTFLDRIKETSTSTGTGTFTLAGAVLGYKVFSNGTYKYCIVNDTESEWEVGEGTVASGVLTRTTIEASSNGGAAVSFSAGTKQVFNTVSAAYVNSLVPYTGATASVNLGEYGLTAGQLTLDTSPTGTAVVGTTRWNDTIGSSETLLKGGNVLLKDGVDLVARVVNKVTPATTLTKAAYKAVRVSGAQGQRLAVAYAQANNDNNSADTLGLVCETIAQNQEGFIITVGQLLDVNTTGSLQGETWADGDVLYLSPTTAGNLTNIKPNGSTGHIVVIGYVEYAHANNGKIYVKVQNGWELTELHDTYISSVANNDVLTYESASDLWKNKSIATILGYTPANDSLVMKLAGSQTATGYKTFSIGLQTTTGDNYLNYTSGATYIGYSAAPVGSYKFAVSGASFLNGIATIYNSAFAFTPVTIKGGSTDGSIYIGGSSMAGNNAVRNVVINPINSYSSITGNSNTIVGRSASASLTSGTNNHYFGLGGNGISTGSSNLLLGNIGHTFSGNQSGILVINTRGENNSQGVNYDYPNTNNWSFIGGYSSGNANNSFYFGAAPFINHGYPSSTSDITFYAPSGISTDIFGGNFILSAGRGTGTGTPGKFIIQTSTATTTGTTLQTLSNRLEIDGTGQLKLNGYTSTSVFTGTVAGLLGFDSSGNVITTSASGISGSGTAGQVAYWTGTSAVGGSGNFTYSSGILSLTRDNGINSGSFDAIITAQKSSTLQKISLGYYSRNTTATDFVGIQFSTNLGFYYNNTFAAGLGINGFLSIGGESLNTINYNNLTTLHVPGGIQLNGAASFTAHTSYPTIYAGGITGGGGDLVLQSRSNSSRYIIFATGTTPTLAMSVTPAQNILIGNTTTDSGYRLDINGTGASTGALRVTGGSTLIVGGGSTSATNALVVQNSSATNLLTVRNDGQMKLGSATETSSFTRDFIIAKNGAGIITALTVFNNSTTGYTGFYIGESNTNLAFNFKYGSAITGNWTGTSLPIANTYQIATGSNNDLPMLLQGTPIILAPGVTATNIGVRHSAGSFRITTLANVHTNGTALLDLDASTTSYASLRIRSGTAPTSPNDGDIWQDGTNIYIRMGGITKTFTIV